LGGWGGVGLGGVGGKGGGCGPGYVLWRALKVAPEEVGRSAGCLRWSEQESAERAGREASK